MPKLISLELNELNFDFIRVYCQQGELPTFRTLLDECQLFETEAERAHPYLEPWIQWPTIYSGMDFAEHRIFRLGDISDRNHDQIWELLERNGISVGAVSPMNAANRCRKPDFFVPDPWTTTEISGDEALHDLYAVIRDLVNSNAHEDRSLGAIALKLLPHVGRHALASSMPTYARIVGRSLRFKWARAIFLDRFLADLFIRLRGQSDTQFASLFLNAAAHIQHHHMFDCGVYDGESANPDWYSNARQRGVDPLLFVYQVYDGILRDMLKLSETRLLVTTGLSQYPNDRCVFQYRFKDHAASLARLGVTAEVAPRMSRDFLLEFGSAEQAAEAEVTLLKATCAGAPLFAIENRGRSLFCQIVHYGPAEAFADVQANGRAVDLREEIALVSIENGLHRTTGYHVDTSIPASNGETLPSIPLRQIFFKTVSAFDVGSGSVPTAITA